MPVEDLDALLERMPAIARSVNAFTSEAVQKDAFQALVSAFSGGEASALRGDTSQGAPEKSPDAATQEGAVPPKQPRRTVRRARIPDKQGTSSGFDALEVINSIKEDSRFDAFRTKIILGTPSRSQLVKFVSWFTHDKALSSNNIQAVLQGLGIRIHPKTSSNGLSDSKEDYIRLPEGYKLSARAYDEFEKWILGVEES